MTEKEVVLVTGAQAQLGREVCVEVLRSREEARAIALVPANRRAAAEGWMAGLDVGLARRLRLLEGDPAAIDLGLSREELGLLSAEVTSVHHCAGNLHAGADRTVAERVNVGGAREAIELASQCERLERLVMHSTAFVSGDRKGLVREEDLKAGQTFHSVVEETYARAEKLMRAAMGRLPITVVRPTTVVGSSRTGEVEPSEGIYLTVLFMVTSGAELGLPLPARGEVPLNMVPVDWVAEASVALGRDPDARGRTFHLVHPRPPHAIEVFEMLSKAIGRPVPRLSIPAGLTRAILKAPGLERVADGPRALLASMLTEVTYDADATRRRLEALGVRPCPSFESYVDRLVTYVRQHGRPSEPPPRLTGERPA